MAVPRKLMQQRIRDIGGHFDRFAKVWILPAVAGFPEQRLLRIEDAFTRAVERKIVAQRSSPVGPVYASRFIY
jgi:hypothetical protein